MPTDALIQEIAAYTHALNGLNALASKNAALCLMDSLACAYASLNDPLCTTRLGPVVEGTLVPGGMPIFGTPHVLDPVKAAFDISCMVRWLDFSDTTFTGGHPSDNVGAILAAAHHRDRLNRHRSEAPITMKDVMIALAGAYEIQGRLAHKNKIDALSLGLDHVLFVKVASAAVACKLLGGNELHIAAALGNVFLDGAALNAYRQVPNAGTRKGWAGADASSRGLWHAMAAMRGEMLYPSPLTHSDWGFEKITLKGKKLDVHLEPQNTFVLENVIFKLVPCQRSTTTAFEAAAQLRPWLQGRMSEIKRITITSHDEAIKRTAKLGPLNTPAARDHNLQYVTALGLIEGRIESTMYDAEFAANPLLETLRNLMEVVEDATYSKDHHDFAVRSCANAVQIELKDGSLSPKVEVMFPMGDPSQRERLGSGLREKFLLYCKPQQPECLDELSLLFEDASALERLTLHEWMAYFF
jgi:2-methylcitrate dehydratase